MPVYANVTPQPLTDGIQYCVSKILPAVEADLGAPFPVIWGQALCGIVLFNVSGNPGTNSSYVVLQTDLFSDGNFVDVAGAVFTALSGQGRFIMSAGVAGALCVQNTRVAGTAPQTTGANQMTLGGRLRFVGKSSLTAGSSSSGSSGSPILQCTCTINYKILGLR